MLSEKTNAQSHCFTLRQRNYHDQLSNENLSKASGNRAFRAVRVKTLLLFSVQKHTGKTITRSVKTASTKAIIAPFFFRL
jgi:hypothetical protein